MRELDAQTINNIGIDGLVLMELAGRGAYDFIQRQGWLKKDEPILVLAGKGNNGGDAFVVARWLWLSGYQRLTFILLAEKTALRGDARRNMEIFTAIGGQVKEIISLSDWIDESAQIGREFKLVIDGLLGTGLNQEVKGLYAAVIEQLPLMGKYVLALDIPSGLHADRGIPLGVAVKATATVTFGYGKSGLFVYPGREYAGQTEVVDIGIPPFLLPVAPTTELLTTELASQLLPPPATANIHKGNKGHLLTIAGSRGKAGAALHTGMAALKIGCGLSTVALPEQVLASLEGCCPDLMFSSLSDNGQGLVGSVADDFLVALMSGKQAVAVGPGLGLHQEVVKLVAELVSRSTLPLVLDADAISAIAKVPAQLKARQAPLILTPHPGEMARLTGINNSREVQQNRLSLATEFAAQYQVYLVLKGAGTIIAAPDGSVAINHSGNPLLATAGSGDLLTGIIAGFLAQNLSPWTAARLGVYLHGLAADHLVHRGKQYGVTASVILAALPAALTELHKL